jgi:hypothetical protein
MFKTQESSGWLIASIIGLIVALIRVLYTGSSNNPFSLWCGAFLFASSLVAGVFVHVLGKK